MSMQNRFLNEKTEKKIDELLSLMTLEEKVGQLHQVGSSPVGGFEISLEEKKKLYEAGQLTKEQYERELSEMKFDTQENDVREGKIGSFLGIVGARKCNHLQRIAVEESRLGIPLLFGLDVIHGYRTTYPIPLAEACSFDDSIDDKIGFSMNIGNNSSTQKNGTVIVETLPYNGVNGTSFNGNLVVTEFSAGTTDSAENSNSLLNNFTFYYTTKDTYKGYTSADFGSNYDFATNTNWTELTLSATANTVMGRPYGVFENFPDEAAQTNQITAIVAVGNLPAGQTLKMHITVKLPGGKPKDCLVNYLSQGTLSCYARTQVVSRSLEGLAWKDTNANGLQDEGEERISGVKVSLYKHNGTNYEPYMKDGNPVSVVTGQSVSVQDSSPTVYEQGRYKFTDLPAGTFAVRFEDGGTQPISSFIASPNKSGGDDMINSDGVAYYSNDRSSLEYTRIEGIVMKPAKDLTYGTDESKYHDSGFYDRGYELPKSGGSGTAVYTAGGFLMFIFAAFILLNKYFRRVKRGL